MTTADPLDRLPRATRRRLDALSEEVDRLGLDVLPLFAARPLGVDHDRAVENAELVAIETGRQAVVAEARRIAWDYIDRRYVAGGYHPGYGLTAPPATASGPDRANLAASFGDAVIAIVLADWLDPADLDELLGPWASLEA